MRYLLALLAASALQGQEAKQIMQRALERDERNLAVLDTYMYERRTVQRAFEKNGTLKETKEKVHEVFHIDGAEIERLIEREGKPLTPKEQADEQKRVDKEVAKIRGESPKQRAKRRGETDKDRREEIEARREVLEAFDFELIGTQSIAGRDCWGIRGIPRANFQGKGRRADQMKKLKGTAWIDQQTHELTRLELDTHDTLSFGWFLLRLQPGAKIRLEQTLVNGEVWLPREIDIRADARILGKMLRVGLELRYSNFKKFSSDSKLVTAEP
jgi:hypothetical protein